MPFQLGVINIAATRDYTGTATIQESLVVPVLSAQPKHEFAPFQSQRGDSDFVVFGRAPGAYRLLEIIKRDYFANLFFEVELDSRRRSTSLSHTEA